MAGGYIGEVGDANLSVDVPSEHRVYGLGELRIILLVDTARVDPNPVTAPSFDLIAAVADLTCDEVAS